MPTSTTSAALRARIESFTADLANIVRAAALEAVTSALGAPTAPARRGPGRPVKSGTPSPIVASGSVGGGRRDPGYPDRSNCEKQLGLVLNIL